MEKETFEYKCINLREIIKAIRDSSDPKNHIGDNVLCLEYLNAQGAHGWRVINNPNEMIIYLERKTLEQRSI